MLLALSTQISLNGIFACAPIYKIDTSWFLIYFEYRYTSRTFAPILKIGTFCKSVSILKIGTFRKSVSILKIGT